MLIGMATASGPVRGKRRRENSLSWLPLVIGIVATPVALYAASVLALSGTSELMMLFPFAQVVQSPRLQIPWNDVSQLAQWLMYLQFPLYGLLMTWLLRASRGFMAALGSVMLLHIGGWVAAYLLFHL
ncbi:MAG: hypothetical protein WAM66_14095 [Acidobacteriaceae bacterium]